MTSLVDQLLLIMKPLKSAWKIAKLAYILHRMSVFLKLMDFFSWLAVARIALVKPDKAKGIEDVILRGAQYGQITEKVC